MNVAAKGIRLRFYRAPRHERIVRATSQIPCSDASHAPIFQRFQRLSNPPLMMVGDARVRPQRPSPARRLDWNHRLVTDATKRRTMICFPP